VIIETSILPLRATLSRLQITTNIDSVNIAP